MNGKITYRQQYTRCGKERCRKCKEGAGHGPYWYAYWSENGRTISKYIGIHPPAEIQQEAQKTTSTHIKSAISPKEASEIATSVKASLSQKSMLESMEEAGKSPGQVGSEAMGAQVHLRIYLLGQFYVERKEGNEWQTVANRTWQRRRARALLGCLLSQTGRRMGREQAMEALWPDLEIETAANRLNGAVHELRQILEPGLARPAASQMLRLERDILILADSTHIWVDAEAFEGLLNKANSVKDPLLVEQRLEEAAALYGGDYLLEELYSEWAGSRRDSLRRGWMGLLLELAELRAARGALTSAIEPLDRLLTADPIHETAVRRLMVLLTQLDRRGEAIRAYQRLASILKRDYESEPLPETVELYKALRQGQIQVSSSVAGSLPVATPVQTNGDKGTRNQQFFQERHDTFGTSTLQRDTRVPLAPPHNLPRPTLSLGRQKQSLLIGREREMETMSQILLAIDNISTQSAEKGHKKTSERDRSLANGQARFVVLMGETGIGKTRLAEELSHKAQAHGWLVAWTRAYEQEGAIPYRPWTDILRTLLQDIPLDRLINIIEGKTSLATSENPGTRNTSATTQARLTSLASLLPELPIHQALSLPQNRLQAAAVPEQDRFHLWEAMLSLLSALSQPTPLLLVLDDLHWTDDSSLELLAYLARHRQNERIMLLATCRDIELAPSASLRSLLNDLRREQVLITLPLQPLTPDQIGRLISHLPRELVLSIQHLAGGNPLFAEELARFSEPTPSESLTKGSTNQPLGSLKELATGVNRSTPLPETIAAVLERRLNKLSGDCQLLLSKAAVLGRSFEFSLLIRITGDAKTDEDTALDLLEEALRSGLISEQVNGARIIYHFWHPLIVSHLYECLSAARRTQLHRRAAQALIELHADNEEGVAATIVYHLEKYGQEKQQLIHYAEMVGNRAMSLSAYSEALHHYQLALQALRSLQVTNPAEAPHAMHVADLLECMAECNARQGNFLEAKQQYTQALELHQAQKIDTSKFASSENFRVWQQEEAQIQSMIWQAIGHVWRVTGEYVRTHECVRHAREALQAAEVTGGVAWACLEHLDGGIYWAEGNYAEARRHVEASLEILEEFMRKLQLQEAQEGTLAQKERILAPLPMTRSRRALREDPQALGRARESLGVIFMSMGLHSEALQHLHAALALFEKHDLVGEIGQVCSNIGALHTRRGQYETAASYFKRSLELIERTGDIPSKALVTGNLGEVAGRVGNLQEAETWLQDSLKLAEQISDRNVICWSLGTLSYVQQNQGKSYEALKKVRRSVIMGRSMKSPVQIGFSLVALAEWRIAEAMAIYKPELEHLGGKTSPRAEVKIPAWNNLLQAAKAAVVRALALENIEAETECTAMLVLATVHYLLMDLDKAYEQAQQVLQRTVQSEMVYLIGRSQRLLGQIQTARDFEQEATTYFAAALLTFKQHGLQLDYARTLLRYGATLLLRSLPVTVGYGGQEETPINTPLYQKGLDYVHEARDIFEVCKASIELQWAESILANPTHTEQAAH